MGPRPPRSVRGHPGCPAGVEKSPLGGESTWKQLKKFQEEKLKKFDAAFAGANRLIRLAFSASLLLDPALDPVASSLIPELPAMSLHRRRGGDTFVSARSMVSGHSLVRLGCL
jgi:hypothetical protein